MGTGLLPTPPACERAAWVRAGVEKEAPQALQKPRVVIAGAGIGGLVLAVGLLKQGFQVQCLERDMTAIRGEGKYRGPIQVTTLPCALMRASAAINEQHSVVGTAALGRSAGRAGTPGASGHGVPLHGIRVHARWRCCACSGRPPSLRAGPMMLCCSLLMAGLNFLIST